MKRNLKEQCKDNMNQKMQVKYFIRYRQLANNQQSINNQQLIKGQQGITLLALIIIIILLLIVSGVTLNAALRR